MFFSDTFHQSNLLVFTDGDLSPRAENAAIQSDENLADTKTILCDNRYLLEENEKNFIIHISILKNLFLAHEINKSLCYDTGICTLSCFQKSLVVRK
jgi:tartrate dehydratase alpha subunit/fumarate hydratase class I-like protein